MKLNIEIWADNTNFLSENGYNLLNESIVCYKNGAYRSSFLTSYLAFMVTLRDRILDYKECPEYVNLETWRKIINDLDDDNLWEECIIQLLEQEQLPVQIFSCKGKASVKSLLSTNKVYLSNDFDNCIKGFEDNNLDEVREFIISFSSIKKNGKQSSIGKSRRNAHIFNISVRDFSARFNYFRTIRNQCAHYKMGEIKFGSYNIDSFWEFMKSYLPKLQIGGDVDYWNKTIINCYKFYKDEDSLHRSTFNALRKCCFDANVLTQILENVISYTGINLRDPNKFESKIDFFKKIFEYDWIREPFLCVVIKNTYDKNLISLSFLETFYLEMPPIMKEYLHNNMEYWKGEVYDKLIFTMNEPHYKYQQMNNSMFNIWLDLSNSLDNNKDKQKKLFISMKLDYLNTLVKNDDIHFDQLYDINFFESKLIELQNKLFSFDDLYQIWNRNLEIYLWTLENLLSKNKLGDKKTNELIEHISFFLEKLHRILNEELDYHCKFKTSKLIINTIQSGKFNFLNSIYDNIIQ